MGVLGEEALGVNSLFTQILSMMSLVELGIGPAIVFTLYKPLSENNKEQISAIMSLYRKIYTGIGLLILLLGGILTPFIKNFITGDISEVKNIYMIFILFVLNSSLSYFNAYKQNLIIADQKKYITVIYHYILYITMNIIQIIILLTTGNYLIYLLIQIIFTVIENIVLSIKTKFMYPYLKKYKNCAVEEQTLNSMKKNVKALIFHKVGGLCVSSTSTLIISKFIGIAIVGKYTNYTYVTNSFSTLMNQVFSSITASVGDYNTENSPEKTYDIFKKIFLMNFLIFSFISICIFCLIDDFIRIVFGDNMLLEKMIVFLLVINFYMTGMRSTLLMFKDALGIYHPDRYRPLAEAAVNLILALILVKPLGLTGVLLGTAISNLATNFWIEPYVVYHNAFHRKAIHYFKRYFVYCITLFLAGGITYIFSEKIVVNSLLVLVGKGIVISSISGIILLVLCYILNKKEVLYYFNLVKNLIMR